MNFPMNSLEGKAWIGLGAPGKTGWLLGGQVAEGGAGMGIQKWLEKDPRAFI